MDRFGRAVDLNSRMRAKRIAGLGMIPWADVLFYVPVVYIQPAKFH